MPQQSVIVDIDLQGNKFINHTLPYVLVATAYVVTENDYTIACNGTFNVTLISAITLSNGNTALGKAYEIKNVGVGTITILTTGGQTIDGAVSFSLTAGQSCVLRSNGSNWVVVSGYGIGSGTSSGAKGNVQYRGSTPGTFSASSLFTYDVTGGGGIGNEVLTIGPSGTNLSNNPLSVNSNVNAFMQSNVQNLNAGTSASSDIVATMNNGNDNNGYIDLGINSSGYNDPLYNIGGAGDGYVLSSGGNLTLGTDTSAKSVIFHTAGTTTAQERARITDTQFLAKTQIVSNGGGVGYATGAGGTVTQLTNRSTAVTLNKLCGNITMVAAAQASQAIVTFTFNNSFIESTDLIIVQHRSATNGGAWNFSVVPGTGSCTITVRNVSNASINEATPLRFTIIKGVTA